MKTIILSATLLLLAGGYARGQAAAPAPQKKCEAWLSVSGAHEVRQGGDVTFYANLQGVPANVTATYQWSVSNGEIGDGQGTPAIKMSAKGLKAGETVTATLEVGGLPEECSYVSGSSTTTITAP